MTKVDLCMNPLCKNQIDYVTKILLSLFTHYIVNNSFKYFIANWKKGNRSVVCNNLLIVFFYELVIGIVSFKQFLKMITNGLFIEFSYSFNIHILILLCPWALLGSSFLITSLTISTEKPIDVKTESVWVVNLVGN